jgi:hypothetical protein
MFRYTVPFAVLLYFCFYGHIETNFNNIAGGYTSSLIFIYVVLMLVVLALTGKYKFLFHRFTTNKKPSMIALCSLGMTVVSIPLFFMDGPQVQKLMTFIAMGVSLPLLITGLWRLDPFNAKNESFIAIAKSIIAEENEKAEENQKDLDSYLLDSIKHSLRFADNKTSSISDIRRSIHKAPKADDSLWFRLHAVMVIEKGNFKQYYNFKYENPYAHVIKTFDLTSWFKRVYGTKKVILSLQDGTLDVILPPEVMQHFFCEIKDGQTSSIELYLELNDPNKEFTDYTHCGLSYGEVCRKAMEDYKFYRRLTIGKVLEARKQRKAKRKESDRSVVSATQELLNLHQHLEPSISKFLEAFKGSFSFGDDDYAKLEIPTISTKTLSISPTDNGFKLVSHDPKLTEIVEYTFERNDHAIGGVVFAIKFVNLESFKIGDKDLYKFYEAKVGDIHFNQVNMFEELSIVTPQKNHVDELSKRTLVGAFGGNAFKNAIVNVGKECFSRDITTIYSTNLLAQAMLRYNLSPAELQEANFEGLFDFRVKEKGYPVECWINRDGNEYLIATTILFYKGEDVSGYNHLPFIVFAYYYLKLYELIKAVVNRKDVTMIESFDPTVVSALKLYSTPANDKYESSYKTLYEVEDHTALTSAGGDAMATTNALVRHRHNGAMPYDPQYRENPNSQPKDAGSLHNGHTTI